MNGYENLRRLMYMHDMTKADVIRETGITRPVLVNWEHGRTDPSLKTLKRLAKYFGVKVSFFMEGE